MDGVLCGLQGVHLLLLKAAEINVKLAAAVVFTERPKSSDETDQTARWDQICWLFFFHTNRAEFFLFSDSFLVWKHHNVGFDNQLTKRFLFFFLSEEERLSSAFTPSSLTPD